MVEIDPYTACGEQARHPDQAWTVREHPKRRPRCNRPLGHDGDHVERNLRDFLVVARFADTYAKRAKRW